MATLNRCLRKAGIPSDLESEIREAGGTVDAVGSLIDDHLAQLEDVRAQLRRQGYEVDVEPIAVPDEPPAPERQAAEQPESVGADPTEAAEPDDRSPDDPLYAPRRTPGEEPLQAPKARLGIEDLIRWTVQHREQTIADLERRVRSSTKRDEVKDELRKTLEAYKRVDPKQLADHMRKYPQHYQDAYADQGMDPVLVFDRADRHPVHQPRVQPQAVALPDGEWRAPSIRNNLIRLEEELRKADPSAPKIDVDPGALPDEAGGAFDPTNYLVNVRYHNDLDLIAHEVGHWTGRRFDLLGAADVREIRRELAEFAVHGTSETNGDRQMEEGIAEWFRAWMINPVEADHRAPEFAAVVKKRVTPKVLQALQRFGADFRAWYGSSAAGKEAAGIDQTADAVRKVVKDSAWHKRFGLGLMRMFGKGRQARRRPKGEPPADWREDTSAYDRIKFNVSDKEAPMLSNYLLAMQIAGFDPDKLTPTQHWDFMRKMHRGQGGRVRDGILVHGLVNSDGTRAAFTDGKPMTLQNMVGELMERGGDQWADLLDRAHSYGVAQRTGEIAARLRAQLEDRVQQLAEQLMEETLGDPFREGLAMKRVAEFREKEEAKLGDQLARLTGAGAGVESATAVAEEAVAELEKDPDREAIEAYLKRYREWAGWNLQYLVDSDMLTPTAARRMRKRNEFYIDWHRMFGSDDSLVNVGEHVEGSSRTIHNPLSSLLFSTWSAVVRGDSNRLMLAFTDPLRIGQQSADGKALARLGHKISAAEAEKAFKDHNGYHDGPGGRQQRVYRINRVIQLLDEHGAPIFDPDGEPVFQKISEPWVFEAGTEASLEAGREYDSGILMSVIKGLTAVQRTMITTSPPFRLRLLWRDNVEQVLLTENGSLGSLLRIFSPQGSKEIAGRTVDDWFAAYGADMAGYTAQDRDSLIGEVFAEAERLTKGGTALLSPTTAMRAWERVGREVENHARKREFAQAMRRYLRDGLPAEAAAAKAAIDSRELMDAAARGRVIGQLNGATLFLNAAVQGFLRTTRPLRVATKAYKAGDIGKGNRAMAAFLIRLGTYGSVLMAFRAWQLMDLDDDELEQELSRPAWKRDTTMLFRTPFGEFGVAKPYEWGWMGSGFERLADHMVAKQRGMDQHAARAWEGYGRSFAAAVWPLDKDAFAPGFAPVVEVMTNHSLFMDRPIVSQYEEGLALERRDGQRNASAIGQMIGKIARADARNVDHLIRGYGGSWGSMATSRDWAEFTKRTTGLSGYTSPWQDRDVAWVLENAQALGLDRRKPFHLLRSHLRKASDGDEQARRKAIDVAGRLRERLERDRERFLNRR